MRKDWLEYIKVTSFVVIAASLAVIALNSSKEVSSLQEIAEKLSHIRNTLYNK